MTQGSGSPGRRVFASEWAPCRTTPPNNPLNLTDPLPSLERDSAAHMFWMKTSAEYAAFLIWLRP